MNPPDFSYPESGPYLRRRRRGLFLRRFGLRPPENVDWGPVHKGIAELQNAIDKGLIERPTDYDDPNAVHRSLKNHASGRVLGGDDHGFYPPLLYVATRLEIEKSKPASVMNFGAFFANVDATLALLFPETRFLAVDRGAEFVRLNRSVFCGKNLEFIDADIEAALERRPTVLVHCKTACYLYPHKLERVYRMAASYGVRTIIGVENTGFCFGIEDFYRFSTEPKPSVFYKTAMFVHNYPAMLKSAGFEISSGEIAWNGKNYAVVFTAHAGPSDKTLERMPLQSLAPA